jgi:methylglutaconyl-CoA hydratase
VSGQTLIVAEDGPVLRLTLDRPERRNAFDAALLAALTVAVEQAPERVGVRCVVLAGRGEAFCAGADVDWMRRSADLSEADNVADAERAAALFAAVASCPLPVVARVHGAALGGGAGLVCAADLGRRRRRRDDRLPRGAARASWRPRSRPTWSAASAPGRRGPCS